MSDIQQYSDENRGSLWPVKGFSGKINMSGQNYMVTCCATGAKSDKAPAYIMVLRGEEKEFTTAVFRNKKEGSKSVASCQVNGHWVHFFVNESENPQAPTLRMSAQPVEQQQQQQRPFELPPKSPSEDDLPF